MDQCTDQPRICRIKHLDQPFTAFGPLDFRLRIFEATLDLLIQLIAVGDNNDPRILHILPNPLRKPYHHQTLARSLRMPDDSALL